MVAPLRWVWVLPFLAAFHWARAAPVLMISIDGLKPEFIRAGLIDVAADSRTGPAYTSWKAMPRMASGMAAILDGGQIRERGAFPDADFLIVLRPGFYTGTATSGELVTPFPGAHGGHGFSPAEPGMRAAFFMAGSGIARHRDLGLIDMRRIAPTVAGILGVPLPVAAAPLEVRAGRLPNTR